MVQRQNSTSAKEVARFQRLFLNPSWLTLGGRTSSHQKLAPTFPWIDNCLMMTKSLQDGFCLMLLRSSCHYDPLIILEEIWTMEDVYCVKGLCLCYFITMLRNAEMKYHHPSINVWQDKFTLRWWRGWVLSLLYPKLAYFRFAYSLIRRPHVCTMWPETTWH